ncbi:MAG: hypothetical protein PSV16_00485 [Flavobacterium sp.]|nr:hypothetical protein [Flavobacterium sp.]
MRIEAITNHPAQLQNAINKAFKDNDLKTWSVKKNDKMEDRYTHTGQWEDKAIIKPELLTKKMTFTVIGWENNPPNEATKGYYLGRFTEILMVHFRNYFNHLETYA